MIKVLCIDDSRIYRKIYEQCLSQGNYSVCLAENGRAGLDAADRINPDIVLCDLDMPIMNGFEFLERFKRNNAHAGTPVIVVSSLTDPDDVIRAFEKGAVDYVRKPFHSDELFMRLRVQENQQIRIRRKDNHMTLLRNSVNEKIEEIQDVKNATIFSLAKLAESRDPETGAHLERIQEYVKLISENLTQESAFRSAIDDAFIANIYHMSALHDIGKVGVPDSVLLKPGPLTPPEMELMRTHSQVGGLALDTICHLNKYSAFLEMGRDIAYCHHERWDGAGYPRRLVGSDIPLAARIVAVADVFDALSTKRVYKEALPPAEVKAIMDNEAGRGFDPDVFAAFKRCMPQIREVQEEFADSSGLSVPEKTVV